MTVKERSRITSEGDSKMTGGGRGAQNDVVFS